MELITIHTIAENGYGGNILSVKDNEISPPWERICQVFLWEEKKEIKPFSEKNLKTTNHRYWTNKKKGRAK